jgi:cytochrome c oxidase subunit 3
MASSALATSLGGLQTVQQFHPHHLTLNSPWPILTANSVLAMLTGAVLWFNGIENGTTLFALGTLTTTAAWVLWFKDVTTEGTLLGHHTRVVQSGLSMGVSLFIVTELFVFVSVFWAYLHSSLSPTVELGTQWPPVGIVPLSPLTVPLLNTLLLVSSGATVTYGHHAVLLGQRGPALIGLVLTVVLAVVFTGLQVVEYGQAGFTMPDGAYGSCFYFSTGLHGAHVIVGTVFIAVGLARLWLYHSTRQHHVGLEASIAYWHFVDLVWLFLYLAVYWWSGS